MNQDSTDNAPRDSVSLMHLTHAESSRLCSMRHQRLLVFAIHVATLIKKTQDWQSLDQLEFSERSSRPCPPASPSRAPTPVAGAPAAGGGVSHLLSLPGGASLLSSGLIAFLSLTSILSCFLNRSGRTAVRIAKTTTTTAAAVTAAATFDEERILWSSE